MLEELKATFAPYIDANLVIVDDFDDLLTAEIEIKHLDRGLLVSANFGAFSLVNVKITKKKVVYVFREKQKGGAK